MPTRSQRAIARVRQHPPTALGALVAALVQLLVALTSWALESLPASVPDDVAVALGALLFAVVVAVGAVLGRLAQRFTYPAEFVEEHLLTAEHAIEAAAADGELEA